MLTDDLRFYLSSLSIYKDNGKVFSLLFDLLDKVYSSGNNFYGVSSAYCKFAGELFTAAKGDLGAYINKIIKYSDNVFTRGCAGGENLPDYIYRAAAADINAFNIILKADSKFLKAEITRRYPVSAGEVNMLPDFYNYSEILSFDKAKEFYRKNGFGKFARCKAFSYEMKKGAYTLVPVENPDEIRLSELKQYEVQKEKIIANTLSFLNSGPYNNVLLYGDRGTGKSSTVKALLNEYHHMGLRLVQIDKKNLYGLGELTEMLVKVPLKFILFIDDLTFSENDDSFGMLKAVLEGSVVRRPDNIAIYATSNRRHLIKESFTAREGDEIHKADTIDETMSLSDRFGLTLTFTMPPKDKFLELVLLIAEDKGVLADKETLLLEAERFAIRKGGRSPRLARQFIDDFQARLYI